MEELQSETISRPCRPTGNLPLFSRAFSPYVANDSDDEEANNEGKFFVPTYLKSSNYMQKLDESHQARIQAKRDAKRPSGAKSNSNGAGFAPSALPPGSHRGMSHTVIERAQPFDDELAPAPLPSQWNKEDMAQGLELINNGLGVKFADNRNNHEREREREHEASAVRADHHIPPQVGIYYYEVQILSGKREEYVMPTNASAGCS